MIPPALPDRPRRTALFGGSFDPVHRGHVSIAKTILYQGLADRVLVVPAWRSPLKPMPAANLAHRFNMLQRAFQGIPGIEVSDLEAWPSGESPVPGCAGLLAPCCFTVDTLRRLARLESEPAVCPDCSDPARGAEEFRLVIGADSLHCLESWRGFNEILSLAGLIVVPRPEARPPRSPRAQLPAETLAMEPVNVSSTTVRAMTRQDEMAAATCEAVADYIVARGLYSFSDPRGESLAADALNLSRSLTGPARGNHCLCTGIEAERLAVLYGADPLKARIAGFLHDAARDLPETGIFSILQRARASDNPDIVGLVRGDWPWPVSHGPAAAVLAFEAIGIDDQEILDAVAWHALGNDSMGAVAACVFVADLIEPSRNYAGLAELREMAGFSVARATLGDLLSLGAERKLGYLAATGRTPTGDGRIFLAGNL